MHAKARLGGRKTGWADKVTVHNLVPSLPFLKTDSENEKQHHIHLLNRWSPTKIVDGG